MDRPESGKVYRLTGGPNTPAISNGNSWAESLVDPAHEQVICKAQAVGFNRYSFASASQAEIAEAAEAYLDDLATNDPDRCEACGKLEICDCRVYLV